MADSTQNTSIPLAQTANPQRVCALRKALSQEAAENQSEVASTPPSRELAVSRRGLASSQANHAGTSFNRLIDERSMSPGASIQAVRPSSLAVVRPSDSAGLNRDSRPRPTALH